jgi:hypothetical protein
MVDEDMPHYLGGNGEEVRAVLPLDALLVHESQVSLVYECGSLKGVTGPLSSHVPASEAAQFRVYDRHQFVQRGFVAFAPLNQQPGYFIW